MKEVIINDIILLKYCEEQMVEKEFLEVGDVFPTEKCVCFGQYHDDGDPWWSAALYNFKSEHDCVMALALNIKGLMSPSLFKMMARVVFNYIFNQSNLKRCSSYVRASNKASLRITKAWGMKQEGIKRQGFIYPKIEDMHMFGMLKNECQWI
jgi:hypothetical protein